MKKIIKNIISIILIAIIINTILYPISIGASSQSFVCNVYVTAEDEEGNKISNVKLKEINQEDEIETGQTNKRWLNLKIYPHDYTDNQRFDISVLEVPEGYVLPTGNLQFYLSRDTSDTIIFNQTQNDNSLDFRYTIENISDIYDIRLNLVVILKKEPINVDLDCNVDIQNVANIENTVQIVSNASSANPSIEANKMVQYLQSKGITIQQIKDISGNSIDLDDTKLIGTGTSLISDNGTTYSAIVYGDTTGDGRIDAADISVIINYFLGTNEDLAEISNIAGDIQKDGMLNAADISIMINSFLGNLQGDILKTDNV